MTLNCSLGLINLISQPANGLRPAACEMLCRLQPGSGGQCRHQPLACLCVSYLLSHRIPCLLSPNNPTVEGFCHRLLLVLVSYHQPTRSQVSVPSNQRAGGTYLTLSILYFPSLKLILYCGRRLENEMMLPQRTQQSLDLDCGAPPGVLFKSVLCSPVVFSGLC